jgi:uridine monophosphate synthetase
MIRLSDRRQALRRRRSFFLIFCRSRSPGEPEGSLLFADAWEPQGSRFFLSRKEGNAVKKSRNEGFFASLERACRDKGSLLCVGLDPRLGEQERRDPAAAIEAQNRRVIRATLPYACCYKPNTAFYEAFGPQGLSALQRTLEMIPKDVPVILDAKRGDIGATAEAHAEALFGLYGAGAATVSPYLGGEAIRPLLDREGKGVFVLCRTSNPQSDALQRLRVSGPGRERTEEEPLYLQVAREAVTWGREVGLVVGATDLEALQTVRQALPSVWMLCPGIGPQGGSLEQAVRAGLRADGLGLLVAASRAIADASDPGRLAREYRDRIRQAAGAVRPPAGGPARAATIGTPGAALRELGGEMARLRLMERLLEHGCLQFGQFRLKSGQISPYYMDLRRIISSPPLLARVADAYAGLLREIDFQRIAAIPLAALPIAAAVSLRLGVPFVYPRMVIKEHGTGNSIEGDFRPEDRVVLLDDVISTARSKLEAIEVLAREGLKITDLVVLVDRESGGKEEIERHGVRCHAWARISELLALAASREAQAAIR